MRRLGLTRKKKASASHIRPHSGFYSLPEANVGDEMQIDGTVIMEADNTTASRREWLGLIAALIVGLGAGAGLLVYALGRWASPVELMMWTLAAMVLCAGLIGGVVVPRDVSFRLRNLRGGLMPMGIAVALPLIAGLSWQVAPVRAELRAFAPDSTQISGRVLDDGNRSIVLDECERIAPRYDSRSWRDLLFDSLIGHPEITAQCLARVDAELGAKLNAELLHAWHTRLMKGGMTEAESCQTTKSLTSLSLPPGEVQWRLMSCVLDGDPAAQGCCGPALAGQTANHADWLEQLSARYDPKDERTSAGLIALAFHQQGITENQLLFASSASFEGVRGRKFALSLACDSVRAGEGTIGSHLRASLEGHCPIRLGELRDSRELWLNVCELAMDDLASGGSEPREVLCSSTTSAVMIAAVDEASRAIHHGAASRAESARLFRGIMTNAKAKVQAPEQGEKGVAQWESQMADRFRKASDGDGW